MKAITVIKKNEVCISEVPVPDPPPGFALIKVKAAAMCATDLEVIDGNIAASYPVIPGHEWSGIVEKTGSAEDKCWEGKKVIGSSDVVCLKCEHCRSGNWRYCESFEEIGFKRNGAYAEYMIAPVYGLCEVSSELPFANAALCEPLGVALGTLKKARAKAGQNLLIMGAGSIGLCMLAAAKTMGLNKITVYDLSAGRLETAAKLGAHEVVCEKTQNIEEEIKAIHPFGTDLVIDATGSEDCIQKALRILKRGGTLALAGYGKGRIMNIRIDDIHIKNLKVIGAGNNWNMHKRALELMENGSADLSCMISEILRLEEFERGINLLRSKLDKFIKAVFINE